jgi:hypothetical protein
MLLEVRLPDWTRRLRSIERVKVVLEHGENLGFDQVVFIGLDIILLLEPVWSAGTHAAPVKRL